MSRPTRAMIKPHSPAWACHTYGGVACVFYTANSCPKYATDRCCADHIIWVKRKKRKGGK